MEDILDQDSFQSAGKIDFILLTRAIMDVKVEFLARHAHVCSSPTGAGRCQSAAGLRNAD